MTSSIGDDVEKELRKTTKDAENIRKLPVVGVDPELIEKALILVWELNNSADIGLFVTEDCSLISLPSAAVRKEFLNTMQLAVKALDAVKVMRLVLSQRYKTEFRVP